MISSMIVVPCISQAYIPSLVGW